MKTENKKIGLILKIILFVVLLNVFSNCKKSEDTTVQEEPSVFTVTSSAISSDGILPAEYTCDGQSATLPLSWTGYPSKTAYFAVVMHHVASPTDIHWYWVLYNIPSTVNSLVKNTTGIGTLGTNSVNDQTQYAPPCSQGPGAKSYTITVYALSEKASPSVAANLVTRDALLASIQNITLGSAVLTVTYSRIIK